MEENSAAVECLIRFYINMKYFLKTRLVYESDFINEMVKYCKQQQGFYKYSDKEIRSTWNKIVSKYASLKIRGSTQDRETWKHFEILDSCYEESDFQDGLLPKFSEEMMWFLIECFLKRKTLGKTQRRNSVLDDIHKEFLLCGYLNVTKHDIENKWKHLNLRYEKIKHDPEKLKKFPYLQALSVFHEEKESRLVSMVFTKDLTEILIECFTKNKISCVIHGYDSDKVLSEIQAKFGKLGFYFSKEAIKQKWKKLTNIYKFLVAKGENDTSWIYFEAMKNHFNDDYLLSCKGDEKEEKQKGSKPGHLRQRSKSVGARNGKIDVDESCVTVKSPEIFLEDQSICRTNNKSVKRSFEGYDKNNLPRRRGRPRKNIQSIEENQLSRNKLNDVRRFRPRSISECSELSQKNLHEPSSDIEIEKLLESKNKSVKRLKLNNTVNNSYKKFKTSETPNRTEEIMKNNQSSGVSNKTDIQSTCLNDFPVRQTQNITDTINSADKVPVLSDRTIEQKKERAVGATPITKQFDNELLPFKKRLRVNIGRIDMSPPILEEAENGALVTDFKNQLPAVGEVATEIEKKSFQNNETNDTLENFGPEALKNNQSQDKLQNQNTFEGEHQKNIIVQNPDIKSQNPCLLSVSKMPGAVNNVKSVVNQEEIIDLTRDNYLETGETIMREITETSAGFIKPTSPKNNAEHQTEDTNLSEVSVSHIETSVVYNNISEIVPDMTEGANLQVDDYNPNFYPTDNEQVCTKLNNSDHSEVHIGNSEPYPTQEHCYIENKHCEVQEPDVPFRKPLPVVKENTDQIKWCPKTKTSANPLQNTAKIKFIKNKILILRQELNKLPKLKLIPSRNLENVSVKQTLPGFKFVSQVIKPAASTRISTESEPRKETNTEFNNELINDGSATLSQPLPMENRDFCHRGERSEEFESESVISEAVEDDGLKDNLLATVIDFQEQNNQEFIEIKNLMKQNNLLQRETNRLLRLLLERL